MDSYDLRPPLPTILAHVTRKMRPLIPRDRLITYSRGTLRADGTPDDFAEYRRVAEEDHPSDLVARVWSYVLIDLACEALNPAR